MQSYSLDKMGAITSGLTLAERANIIVPKAVLRGNIGVLTKTKMLAVSAAPYYIRYGVYGLILWAGYKVAKKVVTIFKRKK